jgi:antitoxin component YwqK of YwqJK toxin-antitoxin module
MRRAACLLALAAALSAAGAVEGLASADRGDFLNRVNNYAWVVATAPAYLDAATALAFAKDLRATGTLPPHMVDTVAAAYARAGDYAEAVKLQTQAIERFERGGGTGNSRDDFQARLDLFTAGKPFTEPEKEPTTAPCTLTWQDGSTKAQGPLASDGNYAGRWRYFFQNGKPMAEGLHHGGLQFGLWRRWREDGSLRDEGHYNEGCRLGPWREYHANGKLLAEGWYLERSAGDDVRLGVWTFWDDHGRQVAKGAYARGARVGQWSFTDAEGHDRESTYLGPRDDDAGKLPRRDAPGQLPSPTPEMVEAGGGGGKF